MNSSGTIKGFFSFTVAVAALILVLKIMNWIPFTIQKNSLRQFDSLEQARSALNLRDIYIPSYFPQGVSWPPSGILGQDRPFPALLMEFTGTGKKEVVLILSQTRGGTLTSRNSFELVVVKETVPLLMHGNTALLTVGECDGRQVCSTISWNEQGYTITARMKSTPFELTRIAESMHP